MKPDPPVISVKLRSVDTDHNGKIELAGLLRMIEVYNHRNGAVRLGEYHMQAGTGGGFAPGP